MTDILVNKLNALSTFWIWLLYKNNKIKQYKLYQKGDSQVYKAKETTFEKKIFAYPKETLSLWKLYTFYN